MISVMTFLFRVRWNKIDARKGHFFFNLTLFRFAVAEVVKRPPPPRRGYLIKLITVVVGKYIKEMWHVGW